MQKLKVLIGLSRSGKTTYASKLKGYEYIDFDSYWNYGNPNIEIFMNTLKDILKNGMDCIIDGFLVKHIDKLKELKNIEVEIEILFAPIWMIQERQLHSGNKVDDVSADIEMMERLAEIKGVSFIESTDLTFQKYSRHEFLNHWKYLNREPSKIEDNIFIEKAIPTLPYDKYYQNIDLKDREFTGYTHSDKSWENISKPFSFTGKSVLDLGCFHGYFSFKAKEDGAREVLGVDRSEQVLKTTRTIRNLKRTNCAFLNYDLEYNFPEKSFDVIMCLNLLHHVKNKDTILDNMFKWGKELIFEVDVNDIPIITRYTDKKIFYDIESHRKNRRILMIGKSW